MSDHANEPIRNEPSSWPAIRTLLLIGLGVLIGVFAVWLVNRPEPKDSDRYYPVWYSMIRAKQLAQTLHFKSPDRNHPALVAGFQGWSEHDLKDGWGKPFRCAAVADPAGNDPDIYVWTDWVRDDGRTTLVGARVSADGKVTEFGHPPKD